MLEVVDLVFAACDVGIAGIHEIIQILQLGADPLHVCLLLHRSFSRSTFSIHPIVQIQNVLVGFEQFFASQRSALCIQCLLLDGLHCVDSQQQITLGRHQFELLLLELFAPTVEIFAIAVELFVPAVELTPLQQLLLLHFLQFSRLLR